VFGGDFKISRFFSILKTCDPDAAYCTVDADGPNATVDCGPATFAASTRRAVQKSASSPSVRSFLSPPFRLPEIEVPDTIPAVAQHS